MRNRFAGAAVVVGGTFTGVSLYWALGGTALLDTVGGELAAGGRSGSVTVMVAVWVAVAGKAVATILPIAARRWPGARRLSWLVAAVLCVYGGVLTTIGILVQANMIHASPDADSTALAWHAYLWDPWFLVWGVLVALTLLSTRAPTQLREVSSTAASSSPNLSSSTSGE